MRILYVYHLDAENPSVQSGRPYSILKQMRARGHSVDLLRFPPRAWTRPYLRKLLAAIRGKRYGSEVSSLEAWTYARAIKRQIANAPEPYDIIFSPSIRPFTALKTDIFTVACNDTLFIDLIRTYPQFANDDPAYFRHGQAQEARALANTDLIVLPSHSAVALARNEYDIPTKRLHFAMFGSNLGWYPSACEVEEAISERLANNASGFLFIGRDWLRKGGALVAETAALLRQTGATFSVEIIGVDQPACFPTEWRPFVRFHGSVPLGTPEGARKLFDISRKTGFFFLPSRAEAYGMSFVEAAALGLPLIGRDIGGMRDIIAGDMGIRLATDVRAQEVAAWVETVRSDPRAYNAMAHACLRATQEHLNWDAFWTSCERRIIRDRRDKMLLSSQVGLSNNKTKR